MLMTLSRSLLQGRELKPLIYAQVQDQLRFIDFISERERVCAFSVHTFIFKKRRARVLNGLKRRENNTFFVMMQQ